MPGRHGYAEQGGWANGSGGGSSLAADIFLNARSSNQPAEYVASNSIEFLAGFESGNADTFEAYIDTIGSGSGESGGEGSGMYRYGFNGKEQDNAVNGEHTVIDYGARVFDPRLARFLSVDPLTRSYPELTAYQFASNSPIANIDMDGKEAKYYNIVITQTFDGKGKIVQTTRETTYNQAKEAGWHMHGILPSNTTPGKLGDGTLYSVTKVKIYAADKNGVQHQEISNVGSVYVPPPPRGNTTDAASGLNFGIQVFGSGYNSDDAATTKAGSNMHVISFNFKAFQEVMEPVLLGMDVKSPIGMEPPALDELIEHAGELLVDKAIEKLNQRWESRQKEMETKSKNAPTFCRTCGHTYEKKNDTLSFSRTDLPAEDTINIHNERNLKQD